jgi:putative ABC transport system ATP-binding protein
MPAILEVKNLSVVYQPGTASEILALDNATLDIEAEEFLIIFGPSGCGKSTLLYSISGVEQDILSGEILFKGQDVRKMDKDDFILYHRNSAGLIFQNHNLIPTLNIISNITLPLTFQGIGTRERNRRGKEILERFGISDIANKIPTQLSGGQQQRAGIARALINNPEIILADEPTGNLDSVSARNALDLLKDLRDQFHKTVILVTHESQYLPYADRVIFMKDGKIVDEQRKSTGTTIISGLALQQQVMGRVPKIIAFLDFNTTSDQYQRLELLVQNFLLKAITAQELLHELHRPMKKGGISIFKQKAERMVARLQEIKEYGEIILGAVADDPAFKIQLDYLVDWLFKEDKHVTPESKQVVFKLIEDLMKGEFSETVFEEKLALPIDKKGAGLNLNVAKHISTKLHLII